MEQWVDDLSDEENEKEKKGEKRRKDEKRREKKEEEGRKREKEAGGNLPLMTRLIFFQRLEPVTTEHLVPQSSMHTQTHTQTHTLYVLSYFPKLK